MKGTPEEGVATVDYNFPKPGTTEPLPKQSFVTRVGDQGLRRRLLTIGSTREKIRGPRLSGRALIAPNGYFCATPSKAYSRMSG